MPDCQVHIRQARDNAEFLASFDAERHPDWMVTVAFYTVLHLVEAVLDLQAGLHSSSHNQRTARVRTIGLPLQAVADYVLLRADSQTARYDCTPDALRATLPTALARFDRLRTELCRLLDLPAL